MLRTSRMLYWIFPVLIAVLLLIGCSSDDGDAPPVKQYSAAEVSEMIVLPQEEKDQILDGLLTAGMDTIAAMDTVLVLFLEDPAVAYGEVGSQGIAIAYKNGMVGGIFTDPLDDPGEEPGFLNQDLPLPGTAQANDQKSTAKRAIFLNPHYADRVVYADRIIAYYNNNLPRAGYSELEIYKSEEVTLKKYTELSDHRIVHIYSHGWAWPTRSNIQEVYLMTGEDFNDNTYDEYWDDIQNGDVPLVKVRGIGSKFFVTPSFIFQHNDFNS